MSIVPLPLSTTNRLTAAYAVQSFEAAIQQVLQHSIRFRPTVIDVTVHAQALRFTVRDNRTDVPQNYIDCLVQHKGDHRHTPFLADSYPLPALAATSTVELRVRTPHLAAVHVVHAASTLERRVVPKTDATSILPSTGVQIDVWQTFAGIPVRRQIELSRSVQSLAQAVRYAVVTIAMANPQISLTLHGSNNLVLFRALAEHRLSLSRVQTAFADACHQHWVPVLVNRHSRFRVSGFVAIPGLAHSRLQLLSVDSIPNGNVTLHSAVREAWRCRYSSSVATVEAPHRRFAAYVINCYFIGTEQTNTPTACSPCTPNDRELHSVLSRAVLSALRNVVSSLSPRLPKTSSEFSVDRTDAFCVHPAQERTDHSLHVGRKRPRFADAMVLPIKRKPPSSTCFHPASGSSNTAPQLGQNARSASDLSSPINAQKSFARGLLLRSSPGLNAYEWSDRCIGTRPRPSPTARVSRDETENSGNLFNDKCISIGRESIETLRVVGQVEKKFIVVMDSNSTMYAIDQHAASERVLYERNLRETTTTNVKSWTLPRSKRINVSEDQKAVAEEQRTLLGDWGWTVGLTEEENTLELIQVPQLCQLTGYESIVLRDPEQLRSFLNSLLDGAARGGVPRPFNDAIASAACHAAVRFGDILSKSQCSTLLQSLAQCENPFVCAHGRPSIVPLVMLQEQESV